MQTRGGDGVRGRRTGRGEHGGGRGVAAAGSSDESDANKAESSQGPGVRKRGKKRKSYNIPFTIEQVQVVKVKNIGERGKLKMMKPSNCTPCQQMEVFLDLQDPSSVFRLEIMQKVFHRNILRLEGLVVNSAENKVATFGVPYCGLLSAYIKKGISLCNAEDVAPSSTLQNIIRQIVEGLDELRLHGIYHGNFSFANTYHQKEGRHLIVKLANFQQKAFLTLDAAQLGDWVDLGRALELISAYIKSLNKHYNCILIDDLARKLKNLTNPAQLPRIKQLVLDHVFFWDKNTRTEFSVYTIPKHLANPAFIKKVRDQYKCQIPWNARDYFGLKTAMNEFLVKNRDGKEYDGHSKVHNLTFLSGCYTHEEELKNAITDKQQSVDRVFQLCDPGIFLEAKKLIP